MYLDPGFGSMIIQLLVAGFAVLSGFFVVFRKKLKNHFHKGQAMEDEQPLEDETAEEKSHIIFKTSETNVQEQENTGNVN